MKKGLQFQGHYTLEDGKTFFELLPYLYPRLEDEWKIVLVDISLKEARQIIDCDTIPDNVKVEIYINRDDLAQLELERPHIHVEEISLWDQYMQLFTGVSKIFDPKAVDEIYYRSGNNFEQLKKAFYDVLAVAEGEKVTMQDVNKVLISDKRTYASDVVRAFLGQKTHRYRWMLYNNLVSTLGQDYAYYSIRKFIRNLLTNKNKYLLNNDIDSRFEKDVKSIDAFTIDHAYVVFSKYNTPALLPAAMVCLERRTI